MEKAKESTNEFKSFLQIFAMYAVFIISANILISGVKYHFLFATAILIALLYGLICRGIFTLINRGRKDEKLPSEEQDESGDGELDEKAEDLWWKFCEDSSNEVSPFANEYTAAGFDYENDQLTLSFQYKSGEWVTISAKVMDVYEGSPE